MAGDFNCVTNAKDCSLGLRPDSSIGELNKILRDFDLQDVTDIAQASCLGYTHWQGLCHSRLDRIYASSDIACTSKFYKVIPVAFSDHAMVAATFGTPAFKRFHKPSWSSWKLNESLLADEKLIAQVKEKIKAEQSKKDIDAVGWEELKEQIKIDMISYSQEKAVKNHSLKRSLVQALQTLLEEESKSPGVFTDDIKDCKSQLLSLLEKQYKGAMIRSRVATLQRDEEPMKIFRTRERMRASQNKISELKVGEATFTEQADIEREFLAVYKGLFSEKKVTDQELLKKVTGGLPKISDDVRDILEQEITVSEVEKAINKLAPRKSPGVDGFGTAFYKKFSVQLAPILCNVYHDILVRKLLPPSMRQATVVLIPKKANTSDTPTVDHFRPISLLTTDYKILAKILARRLEHGLSYVVGHHQTYGFRGRSITANTHTMRVVCETAIALQQPIAVLQVDLAKAFDRVSHSFLFALLEACGIGKTLLEYVKLCYKNISARLLINGHPSSEIRVRSSVRQGCPMSPFLFALYLEPLCRAILHDASIQGVMLCEVPTKVLAFADDLTVICKQKADVEKCIKHISEFCNVSQAKMNATKSTGAWLGPWDAKPKVFMGISWTESLPKYLGVGMDTEQLRAGAGAIRFNA